jgi:hypothetical protein
VRQVRARSEKRELTALLTRLGNTRDNAVIDDERLFVV